MGSQQSQDPFYKGPPEPAQKEKKAKKRDAAPEERLDTHDSKES